MARIITGNAIGVGVDMTYNDFFYGWETVANANVMQFTDGEFTITFRGSFYSDGYEIYGHLDSITETHLGRTIYAATGLNKDANIVWNLALMDNDAGAMRYLASGHDDITGTRYADTLVGYDGNDMIYGGAGQDRIVGGKGNDGLWGETGRDILEGGAGADGFIFMSTAEAGRGSARDVIRDFSHAQADKIVLSPIDGNTKVAGNQALTYIGGKGFSGYAGELNYRNGIVSGDVNGDRVADFHIDIANDVQLGASDFLL